MGKRLLDLAPVLGFGYLLGLGLLTILHNVVGWPRSVGEAEVFAVIPAAFALIARLQRDARGDD